MKKLAVLLIVAAMLVPMMPRAAQDCSVSETVGQIEGVE